jgi:putative alpha-1,2-mannosidase
LYAYAGQQWKTAERVRQIMDTFYTAKPNGLCGNEDLGQMSAWYVFSGMGFYPVNPSNGIYVLGSPAVNNATILQRENKNFVVEAINNSEENIYIQKAEYNGKPYSKSWITNDMITGGGVLKLYMGNKPSDFGTRQQDRP